MIEPDFTISIPDDVGQIHFVGIGGSGMSGIARLFLKSGYTVTGSDREEGPYLPPLRDLGAEIHIGHDANNVGAADTLVVTSALWQNNPEYQWALANGIPVLHRSQALAWLINKKRLVTIAGAHGKTTSTGMIITALVELGEAPSFVNGGVIQALGVSADIGAGELFVAEADESDGSFLLYDTAVALITNVDADHLDHYGSHDAFDDAFVTYAQKAKEFVAASSDDPGVLRVTKRLTDKRVLTFGVADDADVRVHSIVTHGPVTFSVDWEGSTYSTTLAVPGRHNAINAAGAFTVLVGLGLDPQQSLEAISAFGGTKRRFELKGTANEVGVYDDYAHHPTEVGVALAAARSVVGDGRIIAVHQPHLYSRTALMAGDFARVYESLADFTVVLDVDGSREDPVEGVTGALVSDRFENPDVVAYRPDWQDAAELVGALARPGDIVMTLSCGSVYRIIPQLLESIDRHANPAAGGVESPGSA